MSSLAEQRREEVFEAAELANPEWKVDWGLPPAIQQSRLDVMGHIISPDSTYVGLGPDAREFSQESLIDINSDPVIFAEIQSGVVADSIEVYTLCTKSAPCVFVKYSHSSGQS